MVFYNLFTLLSVPAEVLRIQTLVIQLLLDEQLEVVSAQRQQTGWIQLLPFCRAEFTQGYKWPLIVALPLTKS